MLAGRGEEEVSLATIDVIKITLKNEYTRACARLVPPPVVISRLHSFESDSRMRAYARIIQIRENRKVLYNLSFSIPYFNNFFSINSILLFMISLRHMYICFYSSHRILKISYFFLFYNLASGFCIIISLISISLIFDIYAFIETVILFH